MPSPPGYMNSRSATNHAGGPQIVTTTFDSAAGSTLVVDGTGLTGGQKIKLHSFLMSANTAGTITLASSGVGSETTLIGHLEVLGDSPVSQDGGFNGLGTCAQGANLSVSSLTAGVDGNLSYSIVT
mgnify:CR=1 FL=1